jgi:hypothetical protein
MMGSTNGDKDIDGEVQRPEDSLAYDEQGGDKNLSLLSSIYNRLDEQFQLLREQKLAQLCTVFLCRFRACPTWDKPSL